MQKWPQYTLLASADDGERPQDCCHRCHNDPRCTMFEVKFQPNSPYVGVCRRYTLILEQPHTATKTSSFYNDVGPIGDWLRMNGSVGMNRTYVYTSTTVRPMGNLLSPGQCPDLHQLYNDQQKQEWMNFRLTIDTETCFHVEFAEALREDSSAARHSIATSTTTQSIISIRRICKVVSRQVLWQLEEQDDTNRHRHLLPFRRRHQ